MKRPHRIVAALAEIRHKSDLTQRDVAARAHVSHRSIENWEQGNTHPSVHTLAAWADALGYRLTLIKNQEAPKC